MNNVSGSGERDLLDIPNLLLLLAVASWCLLMWPLCTAGPLVLDEHGSYWIIDSDLPGSSLNRSLEYAAIPPLSSWLQEVFLNVLGKSEFAFRLPSALCALGAIVVCYLVGAASGCRLAGGLAACIIAWHPEAMDEVRIARCYGLVLLLGAVLMLALIRWQRSPDSFVWAISWSLAGAALIWTHYTAGLVVAVSGFAAAAFCLRAGSNFRPISRLTIAVLLQMGLCLPLVSAVVRLSEWGPYMNFSKADASVLDVIGPFWWAGLPAGYALKVLITRFGKASTNTTEHDIGEENSGSTVRSMAPYFLTAACALIPLIILTGLSSGEISSLSNPRYRIASAPAGACFAALLLSSSWKTAFPCGVAFLLIAWLCSPADPWTLKRLDSPADLDWRQLNAHLAERVEQEEPIFVLSGLVEGYLVPVFEADPVFMEYVACRVSRFYVETHHPRIAIPFRWDIRGTSDAYRERLKSWQNSSGSVWVACATDTDLNRFSMAGVELILESSGYEPVEIKTWPNATLIQYRYSRSDTYDSSR